MLALDMHAMKLLAVALAAATLVDADRVMTSFDFEVSHTSVSPRARA